MKNNNYGLYRDCFLNIYAGMGDFLKKTISKTVEMVIKVRQFSYLLAITIT